MRWVTGCSAVLATVLAPVACDAFEPPVSFEPTEIPEFPGPFCPTAAFTEVSPRTALVGPLFAWVTASEREDIEDGGELLPTLPSSLAPPEQHLAASAHDALAGASPFSVRAGLYGQPRVGRTFWPLAFSAVRTTDEHDQLLAVWLRPDAWMATYAPSDFSVVDAAGIYVSGAISPGRIAGVDMTRFGGCLRMNAPERGFVVFREEAIERFRFGSDVENELEHDITLLRAVLQQVRVESDRNPVNAFSGLACDTLVSPALCLENTYFPAIAWPTDTYLPTVSGLSALIDTLESIPRTEPSGMDFTSTDDQGEWTTVWSGPWLSTGGTDGTGGTSAGGMGGAGSLAGSEG